MATVAKCLRVCLGVPTPAIRKHACHLSSVQNPTHHCIVLFVQYRFLWESPMYWVVLSPLSPSTIPYDHQPAGWKSPCLVQLSCSLLRHSGAWHGAWGVPFLHWLKSMWFTFQDFQVRFYMVLPSVHNSLLTRSKTSASARPSTPGLVQKFRNLQTIHQTPQTYVHQKEFLCYQPVLHLAVS